MPTTSGCKFLNDYKGPDIDPALDNKVCIIQVRSLNLMLTSLVIILSSQNRSQDLDTNIKLLNFRSILTLIPEDEQCADNNRFKYKRIPLKDILGYYQKDSTTYETFIFLYTYLL